MYKENWYEKTWVIVLFLILLFPIGVIMMWQNKYEWENKNKKVITIIGSILFVFALIFIFVPSKSKDEAERVQKENLKVYSFITPREVNLNESISLSPNVKEVGDTEYQFYYKKDGGEKIIIQDYSKDKTCKWVPKESGTYYVYISLKNEDEEIESSSNAIHVLSEKEIAANEKAKQEQEAKEKSEAEQRKQQEELAKQQEETEYDNSVITYDNLARNSTQYVNQKVKFTGKIVQVIEASSTTEYRLEINNDVNQTILISVDNKLLANGKILENDNVTIKGISEGTTSYTTVLGAKKTVPYVKVHSFVINK